MAGWIVLFGNISDLDRRVKRFKRIFSVENVPPLNVEVKTHNSSLVTLLWSWKNNPASGIQDQASIIKDRASSIKDRESSIFPDACVVTNKDKVLLLCGAVTGFGKFGGISDNPNENAKKLLLLWSQNGEQVLKEINGSWSMIIYNKKENQVFLATDRFASRSIWLSKDKSDWVIGNFPSAIVALRQNSATYDPAGLWSLFQTSRHIPGKSIFKEVFSLVAGQKAILMLDARCSILDWYKRRYNPDHSITPKEWGYRFAQALKQSAIRIKKITPEPYLFLSGGLDSRVAAAAFGNDLNTLTLCSQPNFESRVAGLVARSLKTHHRTIVRSPYWYLDTWNAAALITSGNYLMTHAHFIVPSYRISEKAPHASFLLGDLLENLNKHYFSVPKGISFSFTPETLPGLLMKYIPSVSSNEYPVSSIRDLEVRYENQASSIQYPGAGIFNPNIRKHLYESWLEAVRDSAKMVMDVSTDDADRFDTYLRWIDAGVTYTYNMITCMWPLASERNLFFDNEINKLSLQIPSQIRGKGIVHCWILKHLAPDTLLIPDGNDFLPPFMPKSLKKTLKKVRPVLGSFRRDIYHKVKKNCSSMPTAGSWPLLNTLYINNLRFNTALSDLLGNELSFPSDIFELSEVQYTWKSFCKGNTSLLFGINGLLTFALINRLLRENGLCVSRVVNA